MSLPALVVSAFATGFGGINDPESLHDAALTGNLIQAHFAILRCPEAVNAPLIIGKGCSPSPVHIAARRNHVGVLKLLLARGGDVNAPGEAGDTPLHYAVLDGSTEAAELLLKHGATLDVFSAVALNKWKEVQLWFWIANRLGFQNKLANASVDVFWTRKPILIWAIDGGHYRMVELLIHHGANVNPSERKTLWVETPPLHKAMGKGRYDIAELLIRKGAKLDTQDWNGRTALHKTVASKDVAATRYLLKHGASTEIKQNFRAPRINDINIHNSLYAPLHLAVEVESPELVALLLAHGASLAACDNWNRNPVDVASSVIPHWEIGDIFLESVREKSDEPSPDRILCLKLLLRYGGKPGEAPK